MFKRILSKLKWRKLPKSTPSSIDKHITNGNSQLTNGNSQPTSGKSQLTSSEYPLPPTANSMKKREYALEEQYFREKDRELLKEHSHFLGKSGVKK